VLTQQQVARETCVNTITAMIADGIAAIGDGPGTSDQLLGSLMKQYGSQSVTFQSFLRIYLAISPTISRSGTAKATSDALNLTQQECSRLHPDPAPTTTRPATTSTNRSAMPAGGGLGIPQAPALLSDKCTNGEIRSGIAVVECVIGAWRSAKLTSNDQLPITKEARADLAAIPAPKTIESIDCVELETRTQAAGDPGGTISFADIRCSYRIDTNQTLKLTLVTIGASLGSRVREIELTSS